MIFIPPIPELSMYGAVDCGVPNRERICLRPSEKVDLGHFGLLLASRKANGEMTPINDHFFWFGEKIITPPAWIIIFTGAGENRTITEKGVPVHLFFWGKKGILFDTKPNILVIPIVFRIGAFNAIGLLPNPEQVKQLKL
jgi:hypothetical protein